ncbi:hypothetical protein BFP70_07800 [Thioclava sp. SK-1]|uniref:DUF4174 domain-containing protein n=1 Tax=Thioclava sp. SK-1 TaxID=1889770 RepID=UPI000824C359|nr:DUF4174 domain-containing protein [Thioclava sp. SK-1]OCX66016.1 hypothetical protein BFP70_07800 [Thioclava sp. SK-1]
MPATQIRRTISGVLCAVLSIVPFGTALQAQGVPGENSPSEGVSPMAQIDPGADFTPLSADGVNLSELIWLARPVVVFADSPLDPAFTDQMEALNARWPELAARDVVVIFDTRPEPPSALRQKLRPRGFSLVLIAKDGTVSQRKPFPWDGREILRSIDRMPLRREEVRSGAAM